MNRNYVLIYIYYVDINECLVNNGGCEFSCTNLEGISSTTGLGYQCGCDNGYQLAPDNHSCDGMHTCSCKLYVCFAINKNGFNIVIHSTHIGERCALKRMPITFYKLLI